MSNSKEYPRLIAHRGFAKEQPENTIAAVRFANEQADAIEIDVRRCGSGEIVVFHDRTLDRMTGETGLVADKPLETLQQLRIGVSDETIPTLEELLAAVHPAMEMIIELKEPDLASSVITAITRTELAYCLSSFHQTALSQVRECDPTIPIAYTFQPPRWSLELARIGFSGGIGSCWRPVIDRAIQRAVGLNCQAVHPHKALCEHTNLVTRSHDLGLEVAAWTVSSPAEFESLVQTGADSVMSDVVPHDL